MGTNFYYRTNECKHCARYDELHVGKRSGGWSFHFRAHRVLADGTADIVSLADWARVFKTIPGDLYDEYGVVVENPLLFLEELKRPTQEQQDKEDSPEWRGWHSPKPNPDREWRDPEGFSFYDGEFS